MSDGRQKTAHSMAILLRWVLLVCVCLWHPDAIAQEGTVSVSAYYVPYEFEDDRRSDLNIAGLFAYIGRGAHSLETDVSEYRDSRFERFRHDVASVYTFQPYLQPRYRVGLMYSDTALDIDYQFTTANNAVFDLVTHFYAQSQGAVLGIFEDAYSDSGFKHHTRGFDVYVSRHTARLQDDDVIPLQDQWALQLSGYFTLYGKGINDGYMRYGIRHNFIALYEALSMTYEQQQQLEIQVGHHGARFSLDLGGWFGNASYSYQSGGFVSYNSSDRLKKGMAVELGWRFNPRFRGTLKLQRFAYEDADQSRYDAYSTASFRNAVAMLSYRFY